MPEIPFPTDRAMRLALTFKRRMNSSEARVWSELKERWPNLFFPQVAFGPYVADFLSTSEGLCVEVDGARYAERAERDERRDAFFRAHGFRVLRLPCDDVWTRLEAVVDRIGEAVGRRAPMSAREARQKNRKRAQRKKKREQKREERRRAPWLPAVFASPEVLAIWREGEEPRPKKRRRRSSGSKRRKKPTTKGSGVTRMVGHPGVYSPPQLHRRP